MKKLLSVLSLLFVSCFLLMGQSTNFAKVGLEWEKNPAATGYKAYWYQKVGVTNVFDAGNSTNCVLTNLISVNDITWFFVTTYNEVGLESDKSNIISFGYPQPGDTLWISLIPNQLTAYNRVFTYTLTITNKTSTENNVFFDKGSSTNEVVVLDSSVIVTGTGKTRLLSITPANMTGLTQIRLSFGDTNTGDYRIRDFMLNVLGKPTPPNGVKIKLP